MLDLNVRLCDAFHGAAASNVLVDGRLVRLLDDLAYASGPITIHCSQE